MYASFWAQVEKCGFKSDYTYIAGLCPTYADSAFKSIEVIRRWSETNRCEGWKNELGQQVFGKYER